MGRPITLSSPSTENINNLKIGFHWVNNGNGVGTDPSIAIDDITITSSTPLAVELEHFTAEQVNSAIRLNWSTATESENDFFLIQRRSSMGEFEQIAKIDGAGNSTNRLEYDYIDRKPFDSDNYYRLVTLDFNGTQTFSDIVFVPFVEQFEVLSLYPNPSNGNFTLQIRNEMESDMQLNLASPAGKTILKQSHRLEKGVNSIEFELVGIEHGNYIMEVEISGMRKYLSIVIN